MVTCHADGNGNRYCAVVLSLFEMNADPISVFGAVGETVLTLESVQL